MSSDRDHRAASGERRPDQPFYAATADLAGTRVFLAEDEPMLLWALEEVLIDLGCEVVGTAMRVTEALAFVATHTFDVAVLDGKLADGAVDPVVAILAARGTPFIIASGTASADCTERFGNVVAVQKPYKDADLQQALILALAPRSVLLEHTRQPPRA